MIAKWPFTAVYGDAVFCRVADGGGFERGLVLVTRDVIKCLTNKGRMIPCCVESGGERIQCDGARAPWDVDLHSMGRVTTGREAGERIWAALGLPDTARLRRRWGASAQQLRSTIRHLSVDAEGDYTIGCDRLVASGGSKREVNRG